MAAHHYFAHHGQDGSEPAERILAAGYAGGRVTGENLAWGQGERASPAFIVDGWMHSPGHRANILRPGFDEIGIGIVAAPVQTSPVADGATYDTTFGGDS